MKNKIFKILGAFGGIASVLGAMAVWFSKRK